MLYIYWEDLYFILGYGHILFLYIKFSELCLRTSNYRDNKNNRFNGAKYSYNNINQSGKILPVDDDETGNIVKRPEMNKNYSPIGRGLFFHMQVSNMLSEIYIMHLIYFSHYSY